MTPKIDQATADKIRKLYRDGIPNKILAWRFGLAKSTISMIVNGRTWSCDRPSPTPTPGDGTDSYSMKV